MPIVLIMLAFRPVKSHTVSGTVTDEKGNPLSYVSVKYKGSSSGTFTDASGKYSFTISSSSGTLIFSTLGYQTVEMKVNGKAVIDIVLSSSKKELQEVIVTAQGQAAQKRTLGNSNQVYSTRGISGSAPGIYAERNNTSFYQNKDEEYIDFNREGYDKITENQFLKVNDNPLSTFSIDVDAASYSNVRRFF